MIVFFLSIYKPSIEINKLKIKTDSHIKHTFTVLLLVHCGAKIIKVVLLKYQWT